MTTPLPQTSSQPAADASPQLNDNTILPITGAEFMLVRDLVKRSLDGIYEITIGVVGERKLTDASAAATIVRETLTERLNDLLTRRSTHDGSDIVADLAVAIVERLSAEGLIA